MASPSGSKSLTFADYLACRDKAGRLAILTTMRAQHGFLPISLAEDLLCLDLAADEKLAVLETTGSRDGRALEHFLTSGLEAWSQDLAAAAVRIWSQKTDRLLWFRILESCKAPHLSQRVLYTVLDHALHTGGSRVVEVAAAAEGLEDMSPAFHGLLLQRAVQWNVNGPRLDALAARVVSELDRHLHPDNKALPSAVAYIARFAPATLKTLIARRDVGEPWRDQMRAVVAQLDQLDKQVERLAKLIAKPAKGKGDKQRDKVIALWLPLWARHTLTAETVATLFAASVPAEGGADDRFELFGGISEAVFTDALALLADDAVFADTVAAIYGFFAVPTAARLLDLLRGRAAAAKDPAALFAKLPLRLRLELSEGQSPATGKPTPFALVKQEETASLKGGQTPRVVFADYGHGESAEGGESPGTLNARKRFFATAYRGQAAAKNGGTADVWGLLLDAWTAPADAKLGPLAAAARQNEGVFRLCYMNTLARFAGHDQAALKLLDFIRSKEEDDIRAVINALGGIATPRASQELVSILTRPNVTSGLQLEACAILARQDLGNLQNELRSAIKDLSASAGLESGAEVRDAITSLLHPVAAPLTSTSIASSAAVSDAQLDQALTGKIQHYKELSSEVKRALRTSQFFHIQVTAESAPESIDLSPVIDMQYKALELLFRETFEEPCSRVINRGVLQRRLDVIGYARPIPRAMDEFEAYIASLPTIRDIPFFSKFKLRKMLRAICQFRPGKRFTLDGLKAFALFFLCFGRQECRYGLAGLFPLGFPSDKELYDFCKALHILQDFRNRAAHEGFHPDASNDIDGIWRQTAEIVQTMFKGKHFVEDASQQEFAPKNRSTPVIEKKVS